MVRRTPTAASARSASIEPISTSEYAGNAPPRVPYIGYDMNSVLYKAEGISNYNALQLQARKRSLRPALTASYTWSHSLDEQSGLGLFFTGNNPLLPEAELRIVRFRPNPRVPDELQLHHPETDLDKDLGVAVNSWIISGQTIAQSGQPYSIYDFSGSVGSLTSEPTSTSPTRSCR